LVRLSLLYNKGPMIGQIMYTKMCSRTFENSKFKRFHYKNLE